MTVIRTAVAALLVALSVSCTHQAPLEDQAGWNCHTQGNRVCGAGNP